MTVKRFCIPALLAGIALMFMSAPAWSDGWGFGLFRNKLGHGHRYPFQPHGCKVCVPELVKKKRVVYDYVYVPFCVRKCEKCKRGFTLLGGYHKHGCDCNQCREHLKCPDCCVRYKKVLVKRFIDCGHEWKCKVAGPDHDAPLPPAAEFIPIPPPDGGPTKIMPPAKNGIPKKMPPAKNGIPKKMPPAKNGKEKILIPPPAGTAPNPIPGGSPIFSPPPVGSTSTQTAPVIPEVPHVSFSAPVGTTPAPGESNTPSLPNLAIPSAPQVDEPVMPALPSIPDPVR